MTNDTPLPDPWAKLAQDRGIRGTMRGLAEASGVAPSTISRLVRGIGSPSSATRQAVCNALGLSMPQLVSLVRISPAWVGPYVPPDEVHELTPRQRDALTALIRAMAEPEDQPTGATDDLPVAARVDEAGEVERRESAWAERGEESQDPEDGDGG